jgi:GNAT superfamily N-acetyltransferase
MKSGFEDSTQGGARTITLRPVCADDEKFLVEVYGSTRANELNLTNWSQRERQLFIEMQFAAQQQHYRSQFPEAEHSIIVLNGRRAGRLYVARMEDEIRILDITVVAEQRNAGVGGSILKGLMAEAAKVEKPVRIYVERFNPSLRLFERLGFSSIENIHSHFLMQWRPGA